MHSINLGYQNLPLVDLIRKIVEGSDRPALWEFHRRAAFKYEFTGNLTFTDYVGKLTARRIGSLPPEISSLNVAERASEFLTDRFFRLPETPLAFSASAVDVTAIKHRGPDCRLYFRAFLDYVEKSFESRPPSSQLEAEGRSVKMMQGLINRHFHLCFLEANRQSGDFWSRYNWNVKGQRTICVWLPVVIKGRARGDWLSRNIDDVDPLRKGERHRIQEIINQKLVKERSLSFDEGSMIQMKNGSVIWSDPADGSSFPLAQVVAEEKAGNIHLLRRSIQKLGPKKLKEMILRIFEDLGCDSLKDGDIAKDFGLSKSSYSRFAGSRWLDTSNAIPPDLWANTAHVLSTNPDFKKIAKSAGVWEEVVETSNGSMFHEGKETPHDQQSLLYPIDSRGP